MVTERSFGTLPSGEEVKCFHLENASGAYAEVLSFGAVITKICVPDRQGNLIDVVLGYDTLEGYMKTDAFRRMHRTQRKPDRRRTFKLDGQEVILAQNEGKTNNLPQRIRMVLKKKLWTAKHIDQENNSVTFSRISPDGENGFPGEI